jgi:hypothetical protein
MVQRKIAVGKKTLDINDVDAVWYRRSIQPIVPETLSWGEKVFVAGELRHLTTGLVLNPKVTWVNPIANVSIAEHKLYQLQVARQVGFRIPRTLISSDPLELRSFVAGNKSGTICKPIYHGMFFDEESTYSVFTRRVTPESFDAESVKLCPVLLQEEIVRSADVRATFIGSQCFVADIKGDQALVDWRNPESKVSYSTSSLSDTFQKQCKALLDQLGLVYGAFDFVKTPEGDLVFLEVNPTGEWAWLEDQLGFPMRDAFIKLFYGEHK